MPPETKPKAAVKKAAAAYQFPFTLGADPEFTTISGNRTMNTRNILEGFFKGLRQENQGYNFSGGNIGYDGHNATGEVRPKPGSPEQVTANLKSLFNEMHSRVPFVEMSTLTLASPTGGHIHLSVPENLTDIMMNKTQKWHAIERALASFVLVIMMGENKLSREMRKRTSGYGGLMDYRYGQQFTYPNGNPGYTLEVRCPNAEWITSEKLSLGTLAFMAIAWDQILKSANGDKSALDPVAEILFKNQRQADETLGPLLGDFANLQKIFMNKIKPFVRMHPAYPQYKAALELVMNPLAVIEEKERVHYAISEGWGFSTSTKQIKASEFHKDDEIEAKTASFPESIMRNVSQFSWNEDINVQAFATAMSKRCVALGWKPNHEYFLFGLKSVKEIIMRDEEGRFVSGEGAIQTKKDFQFVERKFNKLAPKAVPAYGRFLHPRTGKLVKENELRRVMIGIPSEMRQAMDIKPLIKTILKFEKNPKSMPPIDLAKLPEGESKVEADMKESDAAEAHLEMAFNKADKLVAVPQGLENEGAATADTIGATSTPNGRDFRQLSAWIGRNGLYRIICGRDWAPIGFPTARNFEGNSSYRIVREILQSMQPDSILAMRNDDWNTVVNLGSNFDVATEVLGEIFNVPSQLIDQEWMDGEANSSWTGRLTFSSRASDQASFPYAADSMYLAVEGLINRLNVN